MAELQRNHFALVNKLVAADNRGKAIREHLKLSGAAKIGLPECGSVEPCHSRCE
jgi:hypothetical protein